MAESNHSIKLFGAEISTNDSTVLQSRTKRRRQNEDEEKSISEVEDISGKTEHVEMGELFDVVINTKNDHDNGNSVVLRSRNKEIRWSEDEQKGIFAVEEIHKSEKTGDISSSRTKKIGVAMNTENNGESRKREGNWDEDEQRKFLIGLEKLGKGNWAGTAQEFVRTRTPTQVVRHAQKYFERQKDKRALKSNKSSVFDINLDKESSNTRRCSEDEQKGISEVEEIHESKKTGEIEESSELFDVVVISTENKGGEWHEDEHKAFLIGLKKLGKGKWTRIAKELVPSRTPAKVASHAQKHFDRQKENRALIRNKSSVFDINLDNESSN